MTDAAAPTYVEYLAKYGGMATCGGHLGVMVAPMAAVAHCPPGWIFVDLETATPERVRESLDLAARGRAAWPEK